MKKLLTIICAGMTMFSCSNEIELMNNETTGNKYRVTFDREKRMLYNLSK